MMSLSLFFSSPFILNTTRFYQILSDNKRLTLEKKINKINLEKCQLNINQYENF